MIDCNTDLLKLFDEPCRGVRKKIKITYVARYVRQGHTNQSDFCAKHVVAFVSRLN